MIDFVFSKWYNQIGEFAKKPVITISVKEKVLEYGCYSL